MDKDRAIATTFDLTATIGIEECLDLVPQDGVTKVFRLAVSCQIELSNQLGEQGRAGLSPYRGLPNRLATIGCRAAVADVWPEISEWRWRIDRASVAKKILIIRQLRLQERHVGIDPPSSEALQHAVSEQICVQRRAAASCSYLVTQNVSVGRISLASFCTIQSGTTRSRS